MNVLIIDDQPDVVEGIRQGVNWRFLEIEHVFQAYNSEEARRIIEQKEVQVMLCDIEMPNGSGLELFEWVCMHYPDIKCIFLTAHADFSYAQKALKLGGFDYLVQPAPYELIENALQRALLQLKKEKEQRQVLVYGNYVSRHEKDLLAVLLREYLSGQQESGQTLMQYLNTLSIQIDLKERCWIVCIKILEEKGREQKLDPELQHFVVENTFMEKMGEYACQLLFCVIDGNTYAGVFYDISIGDWKDVCEKLEDFVNMAGEKLHLTVACCTDKDTDVENLPGSFERILEQVESNTIRGRGVFYVVKGEYGQGRKYVAPDFEKMKNCFLLGQYQMANDMVQEYFEELGKRGGIGKKVLTYFQQDFLQLFFDILSTQSVKAHEAFQEEYDIMALRKSTESLEQMYHLVDFVTGYLKGLNGENSKEANPVDRAVAYIRKNIHNNINRTDIADNIYMNPDYLSRLFKKEKNISLTDYIVQEKLKMATAMLKSTGLPVSVIASDIGYTNFSYFTQVFRKSYGMSPSEYRQRYQK